MKLGADAIKKNQSSQQLTFFRLKNVKINNYAD